ncbi:MAG: LPS export ABC transporter permease LptG [Pseudomonadota bacterium]
MKLLDRYIMRTVISYTLMVFAVLLALYFFSTLINEMRYVGRGTYSNKDAILTSILLLPRQAYELFPMVALIGSMLGLGMLATSSELTVMRASGVSISRITVSVLKAGLIMIAFIIAVGEGVAPKLEKEAHNMRLKAMVKSVSLNTGDQLWAKDGNSFISIRRLDPDGEARGVVVYHLKGPRLLEIVAANTAYYRRGEWHLSGVRRTLFGENQVTVERADNLAWPSRLAPEMINLASMKPENLSVWELNELVGFMQENDLASQRYEMAMWLRLVAPLTNVGMLLLALPFVFGSMRSVGVGARVMLGAMIGIGFYLVHNLFSRMALLYDISPAISAATPALLVILLWFLMMRRVT